MSDDKSVKMFPMLLICPIYIMYFILEVFQNVFFSIK